MGDHASGVSFERSKFAKGGQENPYCNDFLLAGKDFMDVTFESDLFEFSVDDVSPDGGPILAERKSSWFPDFSILQEPENSAQEPMKVHVSVHEQLSAIYDEFSQEGSISVAGSVYVKSVSAASFQILFNDDAKCIQRITPVESICRPMVSNEPGLHVELHPLHSNEELLVSTYSCDSKLKPVPLVRQCFCLPCAFSKAGRVISESHFLKF